LAGQAGHFPKTHRGLGHLARKAEAGQWRARLGPRRDRRDRRSRTRTGAGTCYTSPQQGLTMERRKIRASLDPHLEAPTLEPAPALRGAPPAPSERLEATQAAPETLASFLGEPARAFVVRESRRPRRSVA
jgi:hypothetical protein